MLSGRLKCWAVAFDESGIICERSRMVGRATGAPPKVFEWLACASSVWHPAFDSPGYHLWAVVEARNAYHAVQVAETERVKFKGRTNEQDVVSGSLFRPTEPDDGFAIFR